MLDSRKAAVAKADTDGNSLDPTVGLPSLINRVHDYGVGGEFPTFFVGDGRGNEVSPTSLPTC